MQLLMLQPLALTVLDVATSPRRPSLARILARPVTNPLTIASVAGLLLATSDAELPRAVHAPLELIAGMAVPAMLIAYGVALRLGPLPGRGVTPRALANVFVVAMRYERGVLLARDAIFVSTMASAPVAVAISALLA